MRKRGDGGKVGRRRRRQRRRRKKKSSLLPSLLLAPEREDAASCCFSWLSSITPKRLFVCVCVLMRHPKGRSLEAAVAQKSATTGVALN